MDLILYNGQIQTMQGIHDEVEAVAIKDGIIHEIGDTESILKLKTKDTNCIDLKGQFVIPGFNDSHMHLYSFGYTLSWVDCSKATSIQSIQEIVKSYIEDNKIPKGAWIRGWGWNQDYFEGDKRFPTKSDLNDISDEHAIVLSRACGHVMVTNSQAINQSGVDATMVVEGGEFDLETGLFREKALDLIYKHIPELSIEEIKETIVKAMKVANSQGITSIQTDDLSHLPSRNFKKMLQAYEELNAEGKLTCRIYQQSLLQTKAELDEFLFLGYKTGVGDDFFKIGPLKILADGSLGARTAALSKPYHDDPTTKGILTFSDEALKELMETAHLHDMQIATHCIGDGSMRQTFDILDELLSKYPKEDHRHGIIHCQITDKELIDDYKRMNILAYVQPIFIHYDHHIVEDRVGYDLASTSYAFKTMMDKDIVVALGTDCPVEPLKTMPNLYCAVTRQDLKGEPKDGWFSNERLSVYEALKGYITNGAYASFEEEKKGKIQVGMMADITVLNQNLYQIEPKEILNTEVKMTIVNGKIVYS